MSLLDERENQMAHEYWDDVRNGVNPPRHVDKLSTKPAADDDIRSILADGFELRATQEVLRAWFEKRGYLIATIPAHPYRAMRSNGLYLDGKDEWLTYHEMIADLLARVDADEGVAP